MILRESNLTKRNKKAVFAFGFVLAVFVFTFQISSAKQDEKVKVVAITFDDGPYGTSTAKILDILEEKDVKATFFLIGKNAVKHEGEILREIKDGDVLGNHSYSHSRSLSIVSTTTFDADVLKAENMIKSIASVSPVFFRPPYGRTSPSMLKELKSLGYVPIKWTIDTEDWINSKTSHDIENKIVGKVKSGDIILFHDGHENGDSYSRENTIEALPKIIDYLKAEGYEFVTVDKILQISPYK